MGSVKKNLPGPEDTSSKVCILKNDKEKTKVMQRQTLILT